MELLSLEGGVELGDPYALQLPNKMRNARGFAEGDDDTLSLQGSFDGMAGG